VSVAAAKVPNNSQDMVRLLKSLQPLLQDAIRRMMSCRLWEAVYTITGPLSWKDFHLLSGRGGLSLLSCVPFRLHQYKLVFLLQITTFTASA